MPEPAHDTDATPELPPAWKAQGLEPSAALLEQMRSDVSARIAANRGPIARVRAWPTLWRRALVLGVLALISLRGLLGAGKWMTVAAFASLAAVSLYVALRPIHQPEAPRWLRIGLPLAALSLALGSALWLPSGDAPMQSHLACFLPGIGLSLVVAGAFFAVRREPLRFASVAAAGGAGLAANAMLAGRCPMVPTFEHQLLGHASLVVFLLGATWAMGLLRR